MFREMRRIKQKLSEKECRKVLERNTSGVLAVNGDNNYPYSIPLSFVYTDNKIYFHCAKEGHKIDSIRRDNKVSFCVVDQDIIVQEKFTTLFKSVVIFGKARILEDRQEILESITKLALKYSPGITEEKRNKEIYSSLDRLCMVEIEIKHMTGKKAIELI